MRIRASILTPVLLLAISSGLGCTHAGGRLMVDLPNPKALPYQAPDIDEITGIDSSDTPDDAPGPGSAQNQHK
jgi:hypothetical protein